MSEAQQCWRLAPRIPVHVVPMAGPERRPIQPAGDYVLSIGRIEPHKNQWMLAQACFELGYELRLFGRFDPGSEYCKGLTEIGEWSCPGDMLDDASKEQQLAHARVHALPSFFENPGLVHGEAAAFGVPAVMGNRGCEPEYYGEEGIYCDPTSIDDIAAAIEEAWHRPRGYWVELPTWYDVAKRAYEWLN